MIRDPLLLVPGLACTAALWRDQVAALGAGRTVTVADHTRGETIADIAAAILAEAPPRFALAGLSMGGYLAFEILRRAPERVSRLALLDTQARADPPESREIRLQQIAIAEGGGFAKIAALLYPRLVAPARFDDADLAGLVRAMADATGPAAFVRQQKAILTRPDSRPSLAAVRCPTTVIVGEEDVITPVALAREMSDAIAGARLVVVPGSGHLTTLEAPDATSAALRAWLEG